MDHGSSSEIKAAARISQVETMLVIGEYGKGRRTKAEMIISDIKPFLGSQDG